jgi:DNA-binding transcriptional MerR regulator
MAYGHCRETNVNSYTVRQVAKIANITVRTLHHYDALGLLTPTSRSAAGYRLYGEADLLRLQQILFFRELGFPLEQIGTIIEDPHFDQVRALEHHRRMLRAQVTRLERLLETVDKTITRLTEDNMGMTDAELYEGFSQEQIDRYKREAREQYGDQVVEESERRVKGMSKEHWTAVNAEGDAATRAIAELAEQGRAPGDPDVQRHVARHYAWVDHFWHPTPEAYAGLGQLYAEHPEFRAFYDKYRPGLADFLSAAMTIYSEQSM